MKEVKIKESGAVIRVEEERQGEYSYRSVMSDKLYKDDEVEVIGEISYGNLDNFVEKEIKTLECSISVVNKGLEWLTKYRDDLDAPSAKISFSFIDGYNFPIEKSKCCAILNDIKYENECLLSLDKKFLDIRKNDYGN